MRVDMPHPYPEWLEGVRENRRRLKDVGDYLEEDEIFDMITQGPVWPYKRNAQFYILRDRAMLALLFLTGGRIGEVLKVRKSQFNSDEDPEFVVLKGFEISKRKQKTIIRGKSTLGIPSLIIVFCLP